MKKHEKLVNAFLEWKALKSPRTIEFYKVGLRQYFNHCGCQCLTPKSINKFLLSCQKRSLQRSTIYDYFRCIRAFCNWLYKTNQITENPIDLVDRPLKPKTKLPRAPALVDIQKLFEYLERRVNAAIVLKRTKVQYRDIRDLALFSLMLGTGMRVGEIEKLDWSDVDLNKRFIIIRHAKDDDERRVLFTEVVKGDLKLWRNLREEMNVPGIDRIFISHFRRAWRPMTHWGIRRVLANRLGEAGVTKKFTPHQLRHSYASQKIARGASVEDVRRDLGHSSLAMTTIYSMIATEDQDERHDKYAPR